MQDATYVSEVQSLTTHGMAGQADTTAGRSKESSRVALQGMQDSFLLRAFTNVSNVRTIREGKEVTAASVFSAKELEILRWISLGKRYEEVAVLMNMSCNNVGFRMSLILTKLGAATGAGAVGLALRKGIIK